ncbi:RNA-binding protein [Ornithinibacillus gellani]|uniref:YlmH family RNA-binding protein n=1 Tax=Ornithinibacillus gellani TaxID=2293253 RepID=UPI000F4933BA|nr:YlmH/Sll1252 family protein [Ornithinibacillus gellani]TQS75640.1 RNA-binding protein [Ornithinibacillus gellani]
MDLYQHFRKEEHPFIDQVLSWKEDVERSYQTKLTDFLDPREQQIVESLIGTTNEDVQIQLFGGGQYSERKRAVLAPFYEEITPESYQLTLLEAAYPEKFITLSHRDVLGAFMSLGITRGKLGDIYVENGMLQILLAKEISAYVQTNLTSIKQATIRLSEKPIDVFMEKEQEWIYHHHTVSSLRLDNVIKEIYRIPRKAAGEYIAKGLVKVNYRVVEDTKFILQEDDLLSLRKKGRSRLVEIAGQTKKDKIRITTAILK